MLGSWAMLALLALLAMQAELAPAGAAAGADAGAAPSARTCDVMHHGAKGDGVTPDTQAIVAAIAACSAAGGGTVLLPRGKRFLSLPFNLTSNMVLAVEGTLLAPAKPDLTRWPRLPHFPSYQLSRSGHWTRYAPLVGAYNATNITITGRGTGTIDGRGPWWWGTVAGNPKLDAERPRLVEPEWVRGLAVRDITLTQSPYWTLHPIYCEDVAITNIIITGYFAPVDSADSGAAPIPPYNTDGIDPDSCSNVLIENYTYCGGDDAVAVKSGWNWAGIQFGMPSKNILVRNATSGCRGGFTIGSEMSGGVENVTFIDSVSTGQCGMRVSSELGRGGYVRDVRFENIQFSGFSWPHAHAALPATGSTNSSGGGVNIAQQQRWFQEYGPLLAEGGRGGGARTTAAQSQGGGGAPGGGGGGGGGGGLQGGGGPKPKPTNPHSPFLFHVNQVSTNHLLRVTVTPPRQRHAWRPSRAAANATGFAVAARPVLPRRAQHKSVLVTA